MIWLGSRYASQMCEGRDAEKETLAGDNVDTGAEAFVPSALG